MGHWFQPHGGLEASWGIATYTITIQSNTYDRTSLLEGSVELSDRMAERLSAARAEDRKLMKRPLGRAVDVIKSCLAAGSRAP